MKKSTLSEESKAYINRLKSKVSINKIKTVLEKLNGLNILIIGDTILDTYVFTTPKGRAIKDPILSVEYRYEETYAGGVLAIANHVSNFVNKVKLITLIGENNPEIEFLKKGLKPNVDLKTFTKEGSFTTVKKRYVDANRNNKLFKIEYISEKPIPEELSNKITDYLEKEASKYDMVIIGDFGHGFINQAIRRKLEEHSKFLALNAQSNSANMGYNYPTLYQKPHFLSMSEDEIRMPLSMRFEEMDDVIKKFHENTMLENFLVTLGRKGCIYVNKGKLYKAPILTSSVKDTVGAGDSLFALASLFIYAGADQEIIPFVANSAGGIGANIMGNKESIDKKMLLGFMRDVLK